MLLLLYLRVLLRAAFPCNLFRRSGRVTIHFLLRTQYPFLRVRHTRMFDLL